MREAYLIFASLLTAPDGLLTLIGAGVACALSAIIAFRVLAHRFAPAGLSLGVFGTVPPDPNWELKEAEEARERAVSASEAKSRLLATMSHEIRTPLNGILGMAELLVSTGLDAEQKSYVEAMRTSGTALAALIEEILDFSKIEAGKFELTQAPFDLVGLVEGVLELIAPQAQGKALEIASSIAPQLKTRVIGDAGRLRQILINLVGNAVKFTETGGVGLRVSRVGEQLEFAVVDTGPGISPTHRESIFEEFAVADAEALPPAASTGLGLSIARRLAGRMGGSLHLAATSAAGSTFVLRLPLPPARDAQPLAMPASLRGKRALIIAASHFEAPYLAEKLAAAGIEVLWAAGQEASQIFLRGASGAGAVLDIVIVDSALGAAATLALGEAAHTAGVGMSLIFFSPLERRAFGQNALPAFDGWLIKPLRARSLYARLAAAGSHPVGTQPQALSRDPAIDGLEILLAEDNEINALIVLRHLEQFGARVHHVSDGHAALQAVHAALNGERARFDAMVLDIRMPGLDGIEVARRIRGAEQAAGAASCRIVALSADAVAAIAESARAAGIDAFLTKPVDLTRLRRAVAS
jgi:signal transduction histidine kinase/CheY-like chemotaxis protein